MTLILVRIPLTVLFAYTFIKAALRYPELAGGDVIFLRRYGLAGAAVMAILWVLVIGEELNDPVTSKLTQETSLPPQTNLLVQWILAPQRPGFHRPALLLVFVEGIRHPELPHPSLPGLRSVRPGSFLERCFATGIYKFNTIQKSPAHLSNPQGPPRGRLSASSAPGSKPRDHEPEPTATPHTRNGAPPAWRTSPFCSRRIGRLRA